MQDESYIDAARERGREAAQAAASWAVEPGRADADQVRRVLAMIEDGDPRADEFLPARPSLSGEWADEPTPLSLAREVTGEDDPAADLIDTIADAFDAGVTDHFEDACVRELRNAISDDFEREDFDPRGWRGHS